MRAEAELYGTQILRRHVDVVGVFFEQVKSDTTVVAAAAASLGIHVSLDRSVMVDFEEDDAKCM